MSTFTEKQIRALRAKLHRRHVKTREVNGAPVPFLEGWHVIGEANRIFGHDGWDRETQPPHCLWSSKDRDGVACFYAAKVKITVRAGERLIVREGHGTGFGRSALPDLAHELALKAAETDATKRALATFGNPFGLALYDKSQAGVTKPRKPISGKTSSLILRHKGLDQCFEDPKAFIKGALDAASELTSIEAIYRYWEENLSAFSTLRDGRDEGESLIATLVAGLKQRVRTVARAARSRTTADELGPGEAASPISSPCNGSPAPHNDATLSPATEFDPATSNQADPSQGLAFPKEKRLRSKAHLAFVATQPCLICGRKPSYAHHIKFAQARSLALKVSDEFTVPLCATHHDSLHRAGDERGWWARNGILDPLKFADRLWQASRDGLTVEDCDDAQSIHADIESTEHTPNQPP